MIREHLKALAFIGSRSIALFAAELYAAKKAPTITATHGVAAGGDIRDNEIIINQYSLEELRQMIKEEVRGGTSDKADKLSQELAVNKQALLGFFKILKLENIPTEKIAVTLAEIAHRHNASLERLALFNPEAGN